MRKAAHELLAAFDARPAADQRQVAAEILRRVAGTDELPEGALHQLANELFSSYDAQEATESSCQQYVQGQPTGSNP
jgi:hypothetical protein